MEICTRNGILREDHLEKVLSNDTHPFALFSQERARIHGTFEQLDINRVDADRKRSERLWSYAADKDLAAAWYQYPGGKEVRILRRNDFVLNDALIKIAISLRATSSMILITEQTDKNPRGIQERPCGRWVAVPFESAEADLRSKYSTWELLSFSGDELPVSRSVLQREFQRSATTCRADVISLFFPKQKQTSAKTRFELVVTGKSRRVSDQDLKDILVSQRTAHTCDISSPGTNEIMFYIPENEGSPPSSQADKLYECIPDGARLFLTIASGWRSKHVIQFPTISENIDSKEDAQSFEFDPNVGDTLSVQLPEYAKLGLLWQTFDLDSDPLEVVVDSSSIAASAIPLVAPTRETPVYAVCGTVLELRKGLKVSNLTVLPPENKFLSLAQLSFGLLTVDDLHCASNRGDAPELSKALDASAFNQSCSFMGEKLQCFPDKVTELLALFSDDENYTLGPELTKDLGDSPFTASNLSKLQKAYKQSLKSSKTKQNIVSNNSSADKRKLEDIERNLPAQLESTDHRSLAQLFATDSDEHPDPDKLYASNLMSFIVQSTRGAPVCMDDWEISTTSSSRLWRALYSESTFLPANSGCAWDVTASNARPLQINEALRCLPPQMRPSYFHKMKAVGSTLMFESLEVAIQMEAAFWLERQFHASDAHWYQRGAFILEMIHSLRQHIQATNPTTVV